MVSYNVYFTPKDEFTDEEALAKVHGFMRHLDEQDLIRTYRVLRINEAPGFDALPRFHLIVDYDTPEESKRAFDWMVDGAYKVEPHLSLMSLTKEFRISFSEDV